MKRTIALLLAISLLAAFGFGFLAAIFLLLGGLCHEAYAKQGREAQNGKFLHIDLSFVWVILLFCLQR